MDKDKLEGILNLHKLYLEGNEEGRRANLSDANLRSANLSRAYLSRADLRSANLRDAYLRDADLRSANLSLANLRDADLRDAYLRDANLSGADLRDADLRSANLSGANLRDADLSGAVGLLSPQYWLGNFQADEDGILVFKKIGITDYTTPTHWTIEPGAILAEECSPCRTVDCACGVNFGTRSWCEDNYADADLWLCRIRWIDLAGVVVPYNTDGKARCNRLELIEIVE